MSSIKSEPMKLLLDYMYSGSADISSDMLLPFICAAETLSIRGLADKSDALLSAASDSPLLVDAKYSERMEERRRQRQMQRGDAQNDLSDEVHLTVRPAKKADNNNNVVERREKPAERKEPNEPNESEIDVKLEQMFQAVLEGPTGTDQEDDYVMDADDDNAEDEQQVEMAPPINVRVPRTRKTVPTKKQKLADMTPSMNQGPLPLKIKQEMVDAIDSSAAGGEFSRQHFVVLRSHFC